MSLPSNGVGVRRAAVRLVAAIFVLSSVRCEKPREGDSGGEGLPKPKEWPKHFFISATKAYDLARKEGIDLKSYSYGHKVYKDFVPREVEVWKEVVQRSNTEDDFIIVIAYGTWSRVMGPRFEVVEQMQDPDSIRAYFEKFRTTMKKMSEAKGTAVVALEPDPFAYFMSLIRKDYDNDPHNIPALIDESGFDDLPENVPQDFAGFWQVIDFLRKKYAPSVMLAPVIKTWGIGIDPSNVPPGGWDQSPEIDVFVEYYQNYGVDWDALAFNYNPGHVHDDETFRNIATFYAAIAKRMRNEFTHRPVYPYIWKTKITDEQYDGTPVSEWQYQEIALQMRNIEFLASIGFRGMNLGYGNELPRHGGFSPIVAAWLREYFTGEPQEVTPHATLGPVEVTGY